MRPVSQLAILLCCALCSAGTAVAQMPFYTDNADVTGEGTLHFEFFNEFDGLQSAQYPDLRQNTFNYKVNYGLPHALELDIDAPWLSIYRAPGTPTSNGPGDTDMGIKWNFRKSTRPLSAPALSSSLYIEFPTGARSSVPASLITGSTPSRRSRSATRLGSMPILDSSSQAIPAPAFWALRILAAMSTPEASP